MSARQLLPVTQQESAGRSVDLIFFVYFFGTAFVFNMSV